MPISGARFTVERRKLCLWLETEKRKLGSLPADVRRQRDLDLEREFRHRIERLYGDLQGRPHARHRAKVKLN